MLQRHGRKSRRPDIPWDLLTSAGGGKERAVAGPLRLPVQECCNTKIQNPIMGSLLLAPLEV